MTAIETTPRGVELLAIRLGSALERWGSERARRRIPRDDSDPRERMTAAAEVRAARAQRESLLTRIR